MDASEYLKRPYARLVVPDGEGAFAAEILEFPGCLAVGETAANALANLEEVVVDWINVAIEQGQNVPEPFDSAGYSGKLVLRMPKSLHKKASQAAQRDGTSLNQFIVTCIAEQVGTRAVPFRQFVPAHQMVQNITVWMPAGGGLSSSTGSVRSFVTGLPQAGSPWVKNDA